MTEKTRKLLKDRFDTLSIPNCVIKNRPTHGARHGNTEEQRIHHMAYNAWKKCRKKKIDSILDRFLNSPRYRAAQVEHGWTEELCAKHDALAQDYRSYTYTARAHQSLASTWTVHLNISCKTDQWQSDLVMQKLRESEIVCIKSQVKRMGELIPASKDDNEVPTHVWRQVKEVHVLIARRDGSGVRILLHGRHLNFGGHCPAGTNSLIIKKKKFAGFRFQEIAIPCDRRGVCTVHLTRDFFSHIVMCRTCVAWHQGLTAQVFVVRVIKPFPSLPHERAFLIPRFTSP